VGNFQGTYVHPGNSWDLRACSHKPGESLRDFIRRFSKRCTELPSVAQSEIVHTFLEGTTRRTSGARRERSRATRHASRGATTTATKPLLLTQLDRALDRPLEALEFSTTC
jgi:short subunit dehydrogenase-like uncharacterized protein